MATQHYPQNDWARWHFRGNCDVYSHRPRSEQSVTEANWRAAPYWHHLSIDHSAFQMRHEATGDTLPRSQSLPRRPFRQSQTWGCWGLFRMQAPPLRQGLYWRQWLLVRAVVKKDENRTLIRFRTLLLKLEFSPPESATILSIWDFYKSSLSQLWA